MAAEGTADRLSAYVHVLRPLVHLNLGWLPSEPRLDAKRALARHAYEDARSIDEILVRLADLPGTDGPTGRAAGTLADVIDRVARAHGREEYLQFAYGTVKPTLAQRLREHRRQIDPLLDEPTLELVTTILARQERHVDELPAHDPGPLTFELRTEPGEPPQLPLVPAPDTPAREPWSGQTRAQHPALQTALAAEVAAAEILARASHEQRDRPWAYHGDLARLTSDRMRHAGALDALLTRDGGHFAIDDADHDLAPDDPLAAAYALARRAAEAHPPLADDLAAFDRIAARWRD
jgi:hypothetical protein